MNERRRRWPVVLAAVAVVVLVGAVVAQGMWKSANRRACGRQRGVLLW